MYKHLAIIAMLALTPGAALAASGNSATQSGSAAAQAVRPLVLAHSNGFAIKFGRIAVATPGTVIVTSAGVASTTGGVIFFNGSPTSADRFVVSGEPNRQIAITTGGGTVTSGGNSMSFTTTPMLPVSTIPTSGSGFFTVGGTLSVGAGQPPGNYSGTYAVTMSYN